MIERYMLAVLAAALGSAACSERSPEFTGIGPWRLGDTTVADAAKGHCQPVDLEDGRRGTWCFGLQPLKIGARTGELNLYFAGVEPSSKLIEIQVEIRGCVESDLDHWISTNFGPSYEHRNQRAYWKNAFVWIAALMPDRPGRCRLHMLPIGETAEIARISKK